MALVDAVTTRCYYYIAVHVKAAIKAGTLHRNCLRYNFSFQPSSYLSRLNYFRDH
ncbi:hypothetical protein [Providencia rettgeri]|uniref:hypothetical protein n=1 Tax=Providencia rettgeri TaxID=587 RepID=UPI00384C00F7